MSAILSAMVAGYLSAGLLIIFAAISGGQNTSPGQAPRAAAPPPTFEVASIRPDHSDQSFNSNVSENRFAMERCRVIDLIEYSYDLKEEQVLGLPQWVRSERYDISAKIDDSEVLAERTESTDERVSRMRLRVQNLLATRFGLRVHHSVERLPVLALVVAGERPKFSAASLESTSDPGADAKQVSVTMSGHEWVLDLSDEPVHFLTLVLAGQPEVGGRIVVDDTGLRGNYDLKLNWETQRLARTDNSDSGASGSALFTALPDQLGLKLESRKEPVDVIVVDHVDQPSEN